MKNKIINFISFAMGPILGGALTALIIPLTTYFLSPVEYGKASMFTILQGLVASFAYFGFDQAFTREYNEQDDKSKLFMNCIIVPLMLFNVLLLISLFYLHQISNLIYPSKNYVLLVIAFEVLVMFTIFERFILMYLRMSENGKAYSFFTTSIKLCMLIATCILLYFGNRSFTVVVWSTIIGQISADCILIFKYRRLFNFKINQWIDLKLINRMFIFGFPIVISVSLTNFLQMSDRIFLKIYSTYQELGVYSVGLKVMAIMTIIQTIFVNYWVPVSYRWMNEHKDIIVFQKVSEFVNLILSNIVFLMTVIGPIIVLFVSNKYRDVQYYFPLMIIPVYLSCISETTNIGIVFSRKTYLNIYISGITLLANIGLSFLLIPKFGSRGAALANALSYIVFFVLRTIFSAKNGFKIKIISHILILIVLLIVCITKAFFNIEWYYCLIMYIVFFIYSIVRLKAFNFKGFMSSNNMKNNEIE